jgi:hypothetical protein
LTTEAEKGYLNQLMAEDEIASALPRNDNGG